MANRSLAGRVHKGIKEMGTRAPCTFKCDGEPAVEALREEVMHRMGEGAVPQSPLWASRGPTGWSRTASSSSRA